MIDDLGRLLEAINRIKSLVSEDSEKGGDAAVLAYCEMLATICHNFLRLFGSERLGLNEEVGLSRAIGRWSNATTSVLDTVQSTRKFGELEGLLEMAHERGSQLLEECLNFGREHGRD